MPKRPSAKAESPTPAKRVYIMPVYVGVITAIVCLLIFIYLVTSQFGLELKVLLILCDLIITGELLSRLKAAQRIFYGIYMLRTGLGLQTMERLSKTAVWFWNGLADWGLVLGFGLLSYFLFKKTVSRRMILFGAISIIVLLVFVLPYSILGLSFINIEQISSRIQGVGPSSIGDLSLFGYALYGLSVIGGFVAYVMFSLVYNAASILYAIAVAVITSFSSHPNYSGLGQSIPGVAPIIPGITIPLVAGILALAVVLIVHEFAHGILARIGKVKVASSGGLLFGIIPIGAFVEPDEKHIERLEPTIQNRISAAGVASNMMFSLIFFVPTVLFFYFLIPSIQHPYVYILSTIPNTPANGIISPGSNVLSWNGHNVSTISNFSVAAAGDKPHTNVSIVTNNGSFVLEANATGKVGVFIGQGVSDSGGSAGQIALFLYSFFALAFLLNFLVAVVNYLPIPSFDGWRIFNTSIKSKKLVMAMSWLVIITLVVNVLPWIWQA